MPNNLSHSAINRFMMCQESWRLHYKEKIRPTGVNSPLIFGSAWDDTCNTLLLNKGNPFHVFNKAFRKQRINGEEIFLPTYEGVRYSLNDFDSDILSKNDVKLLEKVATKIRVSGHSGYLQLYKELKKKEELTLDEKKFTNLANWLCMRRKGFLMITAFQDKVLPYIEKVRSVQEPIRLENSRGDVITGFCDLVADIKGFGTVFLDNKTSARPYEKDSVIKSEQLGLYMHVLEDKYNTRKGGYIVFQKNVVKNRTKVCSQCGYIGTGAAFKTCSAIVNGDRCHGVWNETISPEICVQIIIDEIPLETEFSVLRQADSVNEKITFGKFTKNKNSCLNWYGQPCPYYNYCHNNQDMTGLIKKESTDAK